ncbi:MAG: hypothetical protein COA49_06000 [Bacteroidetes bacterium]|nr:MAG: hypothetical protein COA49_06000 [Bacteroidota bacterium]
MNKLYSFLDKYGIPLLQHSIIFSLTFESKDDDTSNELDLLIDEALGNIYRTGDIIIRLNREPCFEWHTNFPKEFSEGQTKDDQAALDYLTETTGFNFEDVSCIPERPLLNGHPFLIMLELEGEYHAKFAEGILTGNLVIREKFHEDGRLQLNFINSFGMINKVVGNVGIDGIIKDFGELEEVEGDLWLSTHLIHDQLKSISPLKKVTGNFNLKHTMTSLKTLEFVGGNLNLRKTKITDISSLRFVGGNVLVSKSQLPNIDFSKVNIGGKLKSFNDDFII